MTDKEPPLGATCAFAASDQAPPADAATPRFPARIGRYKVERLLGQGGFGLVFLAHDEQLDRLVAVKVPHVKLVSRPEDAQAYLAEARNVANLDHPNIVPVHDVGDSDGFPCYVVSKYIEGADLAATLKHSRLSSTQAAELVATVAEALHYAHKQGLVHRDVKPGNILLDKSGRPFVVDFGLALREQNLGKAPKHAGTPAYMSPEQARGEGHRVDGRSDIFSLGVVFYELLVGRRPFRSDSQEELLEQVTTHEPRPPRQFDDNIPKELERICQKALAKRASERYSTAKDLADDLRQFLSEQTVNQQTGQAGKRSGSSSDTPVAQPTSTSMASNRSSASSTTPTSDSQPIKIVPKGLRSFDAHDADFFLELLPGPRNREGLPDNLRFWKTRIEETDADQTFSVGLIYGPSGCGKSSLVKAGLVPRLSKHVIVVYLEASAAETELRLLNGLRKRCPTLPDNASLKETLAVLRRGQGIPAGKKVLIVLDQFEQWLHAKKEEENTELVQALRQCDGVRLQCVVMVRDDFWMAATRFMRDLEIRLIEGQNSAAVDLFPIRHAEKVLAAFGRAFSAFPDSSTGASKLQKQFLEQAVSGLVQENKVICVRLALFAEMMKAKAWTPATLREVGGTEGVGVMFLEETFSAATASPQHRLHQKAARRVLKALLPESGTDIKGYMRSRRELLEASGYADRPRDFEELLRILDSEIRLITPTDPEGKEVAEAPSQIQAGGKYYQLTHDYLVHSLRDWLTRKQRETQRGRAELRLADRASFWNAKPENRHLPSWYENVSIRLLTDRRKWTEPQRKMMAQAARTHGLRSLIVAALLITATVAGVSVRNAVVRERDRIAAANLEKQNQTSAEGLVAGLMNADIAQVPPIVTQLERYRALATPMLLAVAARTPTSQQQRRAQLHARLALVTHDEQQVHPLVEELLAANVSYVGVIRDQLAPYEQRFQGDLWDVLHDATEDPARRFRAGLALAAYAAASPQWTPDDDAFLVEQLLAANPEHQPRLREYLRPLDKRLLGNLERLFADPMATVSHQLGAANALAGFAAQDTLRLARLLSAGTPGQYEILYPLVAEAGDVAARQLLDALVREAPAADLSLLERVTLGQRRAGAAIALMRQGERESILDVLRVDSGGGLRGYDPESLTQFIHRSRQRGILPPELLDCVKRADSLRQSKTGEARRIEDRVLYALLLSLGEFELADLPQAQRDGFVEQLANWYASDPSSTVHGATGWLLRHWKQDVLARRVDQTPVPYAPQREWYTVEIRAQAKGLFGPEKVEQTFHITFVVFPASDYLIGAPPDDADRQVNPPRHAVKLTQQIAVSDREITWEQIRSFDLVINFNRRDAWEEQFGHTLTPEEPAFGVSWYEAVAYCRWLTRCAGMAEDDQSYSDPASLDRERFPAEPDPQAGGAPRNWPVNLKKRGFRLPTEAEWEMVCRGETNTAYSFGNDAQLLGRYAWFVENSAKWTHVVGSLRPSPRGLFDIHGNLYEWCHDWYGDYAAEAGAEDPTGPPVGSSRVFRGGGWPDDAVSCRTVYRGTYHPTYRSYDLGFRVAVVPFSQTSGGSGREAE